MKKRYKNRKRIEKMADRLEMADITNNVLVPNPITGEKVYKLVNNRRRLVKGILALPLEEQERRLNEMELRLNNLENNKNDPNSI